MGWVGRMTYVTDPDVARGSIFTRTRIQIPQSSLLALLGMMYPVSLVTRLRNEPSSIPLSDSGL